MRTAQAYMRFALELSKLEKEKAQRVTGLPFREAVKALAEPIESWFDTAMQHLDKYAALKLKLIVLKAEAESLIDKRDLSVKEMHRLEEIANDNSLEMSCSELRLRMIRHRGGPMSNKITVEVQQYLLELESAARERSLEGHELTLLAGELRATANRLAAMAETYSGKRYIIRCLGCLKLNEVSRKDVFSCTPSKGA